MRVRREMKRGNELKAQATILEKHFKGRLTSIIKLQKNIVTNQIKEADGEKGRNLFNVVNATQIMLNKGEYEDGELLSRDAPP